MKLRLERDALHAALNRVAKIVERKSTIVILSHLRLRASAAGLELTSTDLDIEIRTQIAADVDAPGDVTAAAHMLSDIVAKLPGGAQVTLEKSGDNQLTLRSGRARFVLQTLSAEDFPNLAATPFTHRFNIGAETFGELMNSVEFAISTEETRYYLNGVFLHAPERPGPASLRAVATDGHRLARMEIDAPDGAAGMPSVIIPRKTVAELTRLGKASGGSIEIALDSGKLQARFTGKGGTTTFLSKLIDGTYPDYERVIPAANDKKAVLTRQACLDAVERINCISSARGRATKLSFSSGALNLSVTNPDAGEAREEIDINYDGSLLEIGFNAKYLTAALSTLKSDAVLIKLADPGSPALLQEREGAALLIVLMPLRV